MSSRKILILGIGNILLADEGFGVRAVEYLKENYSWPENLELLDGGTRGLLLMADLLDKDLVVILDIVQGGENPGTMYIIEDNDLDASLRIRESAHQGSINDVLVSCDLAGNRPEVLVFGFEPFDCHSLKASLSPQASEKLPAFCDQLVAELKRRLILKN